MSFLSMLFQEQEEDVVGQERAGLSHPMVGIRLFGPLWSTHSIARQRGGGLGWRLGSWAVIMEKWLSGCNRLETSLRCATAELL